MDIKAYDKVKRDAAVQVDIWFTKSPEHWQEKAREAIEACMDPSSSSPLDDCRGRWDLKRRAVTIPTFTDEARALRAYYLALVVLHDTSDLGYTSIAGDLWPTASVQVTDKGRKPVDWQLSLWDAARHVFSDSFGDKSSFVYRATRAVAEDLRLRPLTKKGYAVYELLKALPDGKAMVAQEIMDELARYEGDDAPKGIRIDSGTFKEIVRELKPYGLKNRPKVGYYIQK
jgi:hypothetical protein